MLRKILLPTILLLLAYGFWISPEFKEIAAGVAIFLSGMLSLEEGFRAFSGGVLETILKASTDRLYKSIGFGFISTAIMQSSSLVSILTISFIGAGEAVAFWANGGAQRLGFQLASDQGLIALFDADGTVVDQVWYAPQTPGVSMGRVPDGAAGIEALPLPSPGSGQSGGGAVAS